MMTKKLRHCLGITLVACLLTGCGGATPESTDAPTPSPPTVTPALPTATPLPPAATPIPPTATPILPTVTPVPPEPTETLSIDSFGAQAVDNGDGGRIVTFNWQTSGATDVRIFNGATFVRFGTWWTDLPLDGTHSVEIADTVFKNPQMTLFAADAQGNEISQEIRIDMPCQIDDKFRGNSSPPGTVCPAEAIQTAAAEQRFNNGFMIWLKDVGGGTILVFYDDGRVNQFADTWQSGQPESDPNITPPSGMYQPVRGFGKVWRENNLGDTLGWAIEEEQGFDGKWQRDMSPSLSSDSAYLINRDFQLIRIDGPTSSGNWRFSSAVD